MDEGIRSALIEVRNSGHNGVVTLRGLESRLQRRLVENGLLDQEAIPNGRYRFTVSAVGVFALDQPY